MTPRFSLQFAGQSLDRNWEERYAEILRQVELADRLGYETVSVTEHHFLDDGMVSSPTVVLGGMAGVSESLGVATNILVLPLHNPIEVAEQAAALDLLSGGRFVLGVGLGWRDEEYEAYGIEKRERVGHMVEGIELVRKLLTEEDVTYDGDHYSVDGVTVTPRPVQDRIPIWYGCQSRPAIRRAARMADAWIMANTETHADLEDDREVYEEALDEAGRSYDDIRRPIRREAYVAEDDETAWKEAAPGLLEKYRDVYGQYTDVDHVFQPSDERALDAIKEHGEGRFIVGGPETVIEEIEAYRETLDPDEFMLQMDFAGLDTDKTERSIRTFAEEVMPSF